MARSPKREQDVVLRELRPGDEHGVLELFNRVFAQVDPGFVPRTLGHWNWEFVHNPSPPPPGFDPAARGTWVAESADGEIVGQYAGLMQRVRLDGRPATFIHGVDSMTDPAYRRSLTRGGLFARLGNAYLDHYGGEAPGRVPVIWGPPIPAAYRIGKALVRYVLVRTQLKLVAPPEAVGPAPAGVAVEEVTAFPDDVVGLFERVAPSHRAIVVRDRVHLDWRFLDHPERPYRIALARRAGELVGYTVFRHAAFDRAEAQGVVCDWLVPADEPAAAAALRAWLAARARAAGSERLVVVLPDTTPDWLAFQAAGFRAVPTTYLIAARVYDERHDERWLHHHFYYTLGDMDLV